MPLDRDLRADAGADGLWFSISDIADHLGSLQAERRRARHVPGGCQTGRRMFAGDKSGFPYGKKLWPRIYVIALKIKWI